MGSAQEESFLSLYDDNRLSASFVSFSMFLGAQEFSSSKTWSIALTLPKRLQNRKKSCYDHTQGSASVMVTCLLLDGVFKINDVRQGVSYRIAVRP